MKEKNYQNIVIFFIPSTKLYDKSPTKSLFKRGALHFFKNRLEWIQNDASRAQPKNEYYRSHFFNYYF